MWPWGTHGKRWLAVTWGGSAVAPMRNCRNNMFRTWRPVPAPPWQASTRRPSFRSTDQLGTAAPSSKAFLDAASQQAADPIVAKYTGKLAAADVFTFDNAYVMFESLRIDAGVLGPCGNHPKPRPGLATSNE